MDYQNYEEYMRSVLGYQPMTNNLYNEQMQDFNYGYNFPQMQLNNNDYLNQFYPETYKMIYPVICKVCNKNQKREMKKDLLEEMVTEVYENVEPETRAASNTIPLRNGDVRNPNIKEQDTRHTNFLLRDLITILLLREWGRPNFRPPIRPHMQPPVPGPRPPFNMRNYYY